MASTVKLQVTTSGPFWKHTDQIKKATEQAESLTARKAEADIETRLGSVIRNPTGAYQAAIHIERRATTTVIGDGGASYGPWLESGRTRGPGGVPRTTRFKGYRTFLRTKNKTAKWLREQTQESINQAVKEID